MITLKEALSLDKSELKEIKKEINNLAKEKKLGAYVEEFIESD